MFTQIVNESIHEVAEHPTLVRIMFFGGFVHGLWVFWRTGYTFFTVLEHTVPSANLGGTIWQYLKAIVEYYAAGISTTTTIILLACVGLAYVLYPMGHAMAIAYSDKHSFGQALGTILKKFFVIEAVEGLLLFVAFGGFHVTALRYMYLGDMLGNIFVQIICGLLGIVILIWTFLYSFARVLIVTEDHPGANIASRAQACLSRSSDLVLKDPILTLQFFFLSVFLEIRFFVMAVFTIGIPGFLVWLALQMGLIQEGSVIMIVSISSLVFLLAFMYINAIIDAFFVSYWYRFYCHMRDLS